MKVSKENKRADQQPSPDEGKVQRLSKTRGRAEVSRVGRKLEARGSSYRVIGIYAIVCCANDRVYVGKSINIHRRLIAHKSYLNSKIRSKEHTNRKLYNDVQKYGWESFECYILEQFDEIDEDLIASRELYWMRRLDTVGTRHGYNLRLDSETKMIVTDETRKLISESVKGDKNPNYGNYWTDDQRERMSKDAIMRHELPDSPYNDEWRSKIGKAATQLWKDEEKKRRMADNVSKARTSHVFHQYTMSGEYVRSWDSVHEILKTIPGLRRAGIYNVCSGYRPHYKGTVWKKELKI